MRRKNIGPNAERDRQSPKEVIQDAILDSLQDDPSHCESVLNVEVERLNVPRFLTIRQTAKTGILSEYHLRCMAKQGELPGIYSGSRFKVNFDLLVEKLNQESRGQKHESNL